MRIDTVIFDMDGTLIDSANSILLGLEMVVQSAGYPFLKKIDKSLIGPPLGETLKSLTGIKTQSQVENLIDAFKKYYDEVGYKNTLVYAGVNELLHHLRGRNFQVILATNKRLFPTKKIVNHLKWTSFFDVVYAIDLHADKPFPNKKSMLADLIKENKIDSKNTIYIGDRLEDQDAAMHNNLRSATVSWGYGDYVDASIYSELVHSPSDVAMLLDN